MSVDMNTKKILFKKKHESYEIPFEKIAGDELYPCALYYYVNDEVEYLPNYKAPLWSFLFDKSYFI